MTVALDHAGLSVADLDAGAAFYGAAFGFAREVEFSLGEIRALYDRAPAAGARERLSPRPSPEPGVRFAFLADPEGNLVALVERT